MKRSTVGLDTLSAEKALGSAIRVGLANEAGVVLPRLGASTVKGALWVVFVGASVDLDVAFVTTGTGVVCFTANARRGVAATTACALIVLKV